MCACVCVVASLVQIEELMSLLAQREAQLNSSETKLKRLLYEYKIKVEEAEAATRSAYDVNIGGGGSGDEATVRVVDLAILEVSDLNDMCVIVVWVGACMMYRRLLTLYSQNRTHSSLRALGVQAKFAVAEQEIELLRSELRKSAEGASEMRREVAVRVLQTAQARRR